jgi:hypothetical protein
VEHAQQTFKLSVPSDHGEPAMIRDFVCGLGPPLHDRRDRLHDRLTLASTRRAPNVIEHAYNNDNTREITVHVWFDDAQIGVDVIDSGTPLRPGARTSRSSSRDLVGHKAAWASASCDRDRRDRGRRSTRTATTASASSSASNVALDSNVESSRDRQDAERRLIELSDLLEISQTLNQSLELETILNHLLLASMGRFAIGRGVFLLAQSRRAATASRSPRGCPTSTPARDRGRLRPAAHTLVAEARPRARVLRRATSSPCSSRCIRAGTCVGCSRSARS